MRAEGELVSGKRLIAPDMAIGQPLTVLEQERHDALTNRPPIVGH